jgi:hypothetical protein
MVAAVSPTEFKAPKVTGVFTTSNVDREGREREARNDYGEKLYETDPSSALHATERRDLVWFFGEAEADLGITSTFGQQLAAALSQRISDAAMQDARVLKALRTKLRKGWRPSKKQRVAQRSAITQAFIDHVGPDAFKVAASTDGNARVMPASSHDLSDQTIYMRAPMHSVPADPYENDRVLFLVRKANAVRARLVRTGDNHTRVLNAVYGPATHGEAREALRKRFGELVEVVVALVASQRKDSDPMARTMVIAKLHDDSFVRMMKHGAGAYLRKAASSFADTRHQCACGTWSSQRVCPACVEAR